VSTESQVMALLEEGNPATEIPESAWAGKTASAYLAALNTRSSNVTRLEPKQTRQMRERERPFRWIAAAIAVVVIGVAAFLIYQRSQESPVVTEPTPTTIGAVGSFDGYWESESQKLVIDGDTYWVIEDDGLVDTGEFRSGVSLYFTSSADSPSCAEAMVGIADVDWAEDGQSFNTRLVSTDCPSGFAFGDQFTRVGQFEIPETPSVAAQRDGFFPGLIGIWRSGTMEMEFLNEGTYVITRDGQVFDQGTYETSPGGSDAILEGAAIVLRSDEDSPSCEPGEERSSTYEVADRLAMQLHEDGCLARLNAMLPWMNFKPQG
jgi:hypothetical protein